TASCCACQVRWASSLTGGVGAAAFGASGAFGAFGASGASGVLRACTAGAAGRERVSAAGVAQDGCAAAGPLLAGACGWLGGVSWTGCTVITGRFLLWRCCLRGLRVFCIGFSWCAGLSRD